MQQIPYTNTRPFDMRILITGANGFIGQYCVAAFSKAGWQVRAISRQLLLERPGVEVMRFPLDPMSTDWTTLFRGVNCILHLAGVAHRPTAVLSEYEKINVQLTRVIAEAATACGVERFVYLSSIAVHGRKRSEINETMPVCPDDANGRSKALAEAALHKIAHNGSMHWSIVRSPLVYGPNAPGNFRRLAALVRRGIPLPLLAATEPRSYIGIDNLVSALLCVTSNPKAADKVYLVSDNDDICTADLVRALASGVGRPARLWWLPPRLLRLGASMLGRSDDAQRLLERLQINTRVIREELEWTPLISAHEGIARAMAEKNN